MTRDELYRQYEGLAVKTAASVFRQWAKSLAKRGVTIEDAVQESKLYLLEMVPKLGNPAYTHEQRTAYVVKSIRGRLLNWAKAAVRDGDHRDLADRAPPPDAAEMLDLRDAMAELDPETRDMVLERYDGTWKSLARRHGMSAHQAQARVERGMAMLQKKMNA